MTTERLIDEDIELEVFSDNIESMLELNKIYKNNLLKALLKYNGDYYTEIVTKLGLWKMIVLLNIFWIIYTVPALVINWNVCSELQWFLVAKLLEAMFQSLYCIYNKNNPLIINNKNIYLSTIIVTGQVILYVVCIIRLFMVWFDDSFYSSTMLLILLLDTMKYLSLILFPPNYIIILLSKWYDIETLVPFFTTFNKNNITESFIYNNDYEVHMSNNICNICFQQYEINNKIKVFDDCNHHCHTRCLQLWSKLNDELECPFHS